MRYQKEISKDIFDKFRDNEECLQYFLNCFEVPELRDLKDLRCLLFSEYSLAESAQEEPKIDGFVIFNKQIEAYVISPSRNYIGFWGFRNFFTFRLAQKHHELNDGILRYVLNIHYRPDPNRTDAFNDIREFKVYNVCKLGEDLKNWTETLFEM